MVKIVSFLLEKQLSEVFRQDLAFEALNALVSLHISLPFELFLQAHITGQSRILFAQLLILKRDRAAKVHHMAGCSKLTHRHGVDDSLLFHP